MSRTRGAVDLATRTGHLAAALAAAEGRVEAETLDPVRQVLARASERSARSAEHTVIALAGATGAGKSSVFNALVGAELARTGRQRPTTSRALAAVAGGGGADLLEWLGVTERHDLAAQLGHPAGLVLLDLPDHDSVVAEHRLRADHVTERADVLVWVTNPQKYADAVLHERYLRPLAGHAGVVVLVLNQADRLSPAEVTACLADLRRLAEQDGLGAATVVATSASTGQGIEELRAIVADAVRRREAAVARLVADVRGAASDLLAVIEPQEPTSGRAISDARAQLVATLERAAGVPLVVDAVAGSARRDAVAATGWPVTRWAQRFRADPLRTLGLRGLSAERSSQAGADLVRTSLPSAAPALRSQVASAARHYVDSASGALPVTWQEQLHDETVASVAGMPDALDVAIASTTLEAVRPPRWWSVAGLAQWLWLAALVAGLVWLGALWGMAYLRLPEPFTPVVTWQDWVVPWPTVLVIGGLVLGWLTAGLSRLFGRIGATRRAGKARKALRRSIEDVAVGRLVEPVEANLAAFATLRRELTQARQ